jgi:putative flippase GtrA
MRVNEAWNGTPMFLRNVAISLPMFLVDLAMLYGLVHYAHMQYLDATVAAFLTANVLSYFLARRLVFLGTRRGLKAGLIYFLAIATVSAVAITPLMWLFVTVFHIDVILSRVVTASSVGFAGYVLNVVFNFRVAGRPDTPSV